MTCHRIVGVGILTGILIGTATSTSATPIIDQNFSVTPASLEVILSTTGDSALAQSFTVGIGGALTGADLLVFDGSPAFGPGAPPASDVQVQIRTLLAGLPTETVLTIGIIPADHLSVDPQSEFNHVDFANGIAVVPGEILALTITGIADGWSGQIGSQATYVGGQAFARAHADIPWQPYSAVDPFGRPADFLFRTYVDPTAVPEPSTFMFLIGAAGAFLWNRQAQRHKCHNACFCIFRPTLPSRF
jgi:hypothetical protein